MFVIGDVNYRTLNGKPNQVTYYTTPYPTPLYLKPFGAFIQDQFTLKRLTLGGGVRFDQFRSSYNAIHIEPVRWLPVARDYPGAEVLNWKDLSPRFAASYDLFGNRKDRGQILAGALRPPGGQGQHQQRPPGDCRHQQHQPDLDRSQRRLHRAGRSAEPGAERRARPLAQQQLRQAEHDAALRSRLGERIRRAAVQLGNAAHAAARAGAPGRPGGHLQPPLVRELHRQRQHAGLGRRLRPLLHQRAAGRAAAGRRRPADLRAVRSEEREGRAGGHAPNQLVDLRRSVRALDRPRRLAAGAPPERHHAPGRLQRRHSRWPTIATSWGRSTTPAPTCATGSRRSCRR